jgi:hypothetical protein
VARARLRAGIVGAAAAAILLCPPLAAPAAADPPPCDEATAPAVIFDSLPSVLRIGRSDYFGLVSNPAASSSAPGEVRVRMIYEAGAGAVFYEGSSAERNPYSFYLYLDYGDRPVAIEASYAEQLAGGGECARTLSQIVHPQKRVYFPSRCINERYRPRSVVVACGDGNLYLTSLRWRHWNQTKTLGRGIAHANDCRPYCAAGHFHSYRVRIWLGRPRRCPDQEVVQYKRALISYPAPRYPGGPRSYSVHFACPSAYSF